MGPVWMVRAGQLWPGNVNNYDIQQHYVNRTNITRPHWVKIESVYCIKDENRSEFEFATEWSQHRDFTLQTYWVLVTHIWVINWVIIGSVNGLSPVRRQVITWTIDDIINLTFRNKFQCNLYQNTILFCHENVIENVICKMSAILFSAPAVAWKCQYLCHSGWHYVSGTPHFS